MLLTRGVRMGQTEEGHMPDYRGRRVSLGPGSGEWYGFPSNENCAAHV